MVVQCYKMFVALTIFFLFEPFGLGTQDLGYLPALLDDSVSYRIIFKHGNEFNVKENSGEEASKNLVKMMSADNEEYQCVLPTVASNVKLTGFSYTD